MKHTSWETIHSVLGNLLAAKPGSEDSKSIAWLNLQWKLIVGKDLISVTQVQKLSAKSLFVTVSDKKWFPALKPLREKIITEINKRAGSILVNRIVFQEDSFASPIMGITSFEGKQCSLEQKKTEGTKIDIARYKGLGEMNADQLWETTMNPEHRTLYKVSIEDAVETNRIFSRLMGAEVSGRREFIEKNAKFVVNLDV